MLGGGGIAEHEVSAVSGGGGTDEQEGSAVTGGGGIAEHDLSLISGGGGTAEQEDSAVTGGGGIAEQDGSAVFGGGGMADPDNEVRGGGGMAEQASAVLGAGGIIDPERAWLSAFARTYCPASMIASPSSSPAPDHAPDSTLSIMRLIRPSVNPPHSLRPALPSPRTPPGFMIMYRNRCYLPQTVHDHELSQMSEVWMTTRVRSPRNRSRANSSGSPERA